MARIRLLIGQTAGMLGRKASTYSRRKPFITVHEENDEQQSKGPVGDQPPAMANDSPRAAVDIPRVEHLLASIRGLDIEPPPPLKSRKSELRPRLSIAPSQLEFHELLSCCQQTEEIPFGQWLETASE